MLRLVTPVEAVWPILERWAEGHATVERGVTVPPVRLGTLDGFPTSVAAFATDIPALTNWGRRTSSALARFTWRIPRTSTSR
ncbi:MAG: hypothetical protein IPF87_01935 [Gemmatimonadetes bacterium]|nr:hypothetical protein [Gemmatimonadota bacterium]